MMFVSLAGAHSPPRADLMSRVFRAPANSRSVVHPDADLRGNRIDIGGELIGLHAHLLAALGLRSIENGRMLPRNMRQEMIIKEELDSQLRQQDIDDCAEVKVALIDGDGRISIIRWDNGETSKPDNKMPL